jgi:hypothetical protein
VIVPVATAELLAAGEDELLALEAGLEAELEELLLEQPATAIADSAAMTTAKRRMLTPWVESSRAEISWSWGSPRRRWWP